MRAFWGQVDLPQTSVKVHSTIQSVLKGGQDEVCWQRKVKRRCFLLFVQRLIVIYLELFVHPKLWHPQFPAPPKPRCVHQCYSQVAIKGRCLSSSQQLEGNQHLCGKKRTELASQVDVLLSCFPTWHGSIQCLHPVSVEKEVTAASLHRLDNCSRV